MTTFERARKVCQSIGFKLFRKNMFGEYRLRPHGFTDDRADYFSNDLADIIGTAIEWAKRNSEAASEAARKGTFL